MNIAQKFLLKHYQLSMKLNAFTPLLVSDIMMQFLDKYRNKQCDIHGVVKSFTAEQVVNELEDCETLDDAIMFFKEQK